MEGAHIMVHDIHQSFQTLFRPQTTLVSDKVFTDQQTEKMASNYFSFLYKNLFS